MATESQIAANRTNSQLSTGPKTDAGRAISKLNATKHGLAGSQIVVKGEAPAEYDALRRQLLAEYDPQTEQEAMLVEEVAQNWWRLQRARRTETEVVEHYGGELACFTDPEASKAFQRITRYANRIERAWNKAMLELAKLRKERRQAEQDAAEAARFRAELLVADSPEDLRARIGFVSPNYSRRDGTTG